MEPTNGKYLSPTAVIDSDHPGIAAYAAKIVGKEKDPVQRAILLYYAVRDGIWYTPYCPFHLPEHYRASAILKAGRGYCVCKASLLCALARAGGIPSRLGFADVRNHLATIQLLDYLGTDLFVFHGYNEFYLQGRWVKATPAFNRELCERHRVLPLEFDGRHDSLFQPFNEDKQEFMEYVRDHGTFPDLPLDRILDAWERTYGKERVSGWIARFEASGNKPVSDFDTEDVWTGS